MNFNNDLNRDASKSLIHLSCALCNCWKVKDCNAGWSRGTYEYHYSLFLLSYGCVLNERSILVQHTAVNHQCVLFYDHRHHPQLLYFTNMSFPLIHHNHRSSLSCDHCIKHDIQRTSVPTISDMASCLSGTAFAIKSAGIYSYMYVHVWHASISIFLLRS
jgi:hypothetical protein